MKAYFFTILWIIPFLTQAENKGKIYAYIAHQSIETIKNSPFPAPMGKVFTPEQLEKTTMGIVKKEEISTSKPIALTMSAIDTPKNYPAGVYIIPLNEKIKLDLEKRILSKFQKFKDEDTYILNNSVGVRQLEDYLIFGFDTDGIKEFKLSQLTNLFKNKAAFVLSSNLDGFSSEDKQRTGLGISQVDKFHLEMFIKEKEVSLIIDSTLDLRSTNKISLIPPESNSVLTIKLSKQKLLNLISTGSKDMSSQTMEMLKNFLGNNLLLSVLPNGFFVAIHNPSDQKLDLAELKKSLPPILNIIQRGDFLFLNLSPLNKETLPQIQLRENENSYIKGEIDTKPFTLLGFPKEIPKMIFDIKFDKGTKGTIKLLLNLN